MKTFEDYCERFLIFNVITFDNKDFENDGGISEEVWFSSEFEHLREEFKTWLDILIGSHEKYSVVCNFEFKAMIVGLRVKWNEAK